MWRRIKASASRRAKVSIDDPIYGIGVSGADTSLPCFDGTSTDPKDFLIDLDTDSMEKAADVRSYFYLVAKLTMEGVSAPPEDVEERKMHDDRMVKAGREYLKSARDRGHGLYINSDRDFLAYNVKGEPWYRMTICGVVDSFIKKQDFAWEGEGGFVADGDWIGEIDEKHFISRDEEILLTNIRCTIWWNECLRDGIEPGTRGWDSIISRDYQSDGHPAGLLWLGMQRTSIMRQFWSLSDTLAVAEKRNETLNRDWMREEDYNEDDQPKSKPTQVNWDPEFLAELFPPKQSKKFFKRAK